MTAEQVISSLRTIIHYIGTALAVIALAKAAGVGIPIGFDLQTLCLLAISTRMA